MMLDGDIASLLDWLLRQDPLTAIAIGFLLWLQRQNQKKADTINQLLSGKPASPTDSKETLTK